MRLTNIDLGAITTMPWFPAPQPMSEGSFMQTLQDTVNGVMDGTAAPSLPAEQPSYTEQSPQPQGRTGDVQPQGDVQSTQPQDNAQSTQPQDGVQSAQPQDSVQNVQPQENVQDALPQEDVRDVIPQENVQDVISQENVQDVIPQENVQDVIPQENAQDVIPQENVQDVIPQENVQDAIPQENVQDVIPQESVQDIIPQESVQDTLPQESVQNVQEPEAQEEPKQEPQTAQPKPQPTQHELPESRQDEQPKVKAAQPKEQKKEQDQSDLEENAQYIPQDNVQPAPQESVKDVQPERSVHNTLPEIQHLPQQNRVYETVQYAPRRETPALPVNGIVQDPELLKELADLLQQTEKMLAAPEEMKAKLEELIVQAYKELTDPEKQMEEFEEDILEFLLKFIDKVYGGEPEKVTAIAESYEDEADVDEVLLQAVVEMLEDVRSEDAESGVSEETDEDAPEAEHIPPTHMAREYIRSEIPEDLVAERRRSIGEKQSFADAAILYEAAPQRPQRTEYVQRPIIREEREVPQQAGVIRHPRREVQPVEAVTTEETKTQAQPQTLPQQSDYEQAVAQTAENIYAVLTQVQQNETQIPQTAKPVQPAKAERSVDSAPITAIKPADELEELTRLVRTGDSVKSEQPSFTDHGEKIESPELTVKLPDISEAVPFEAAIAHTPTEVTLTRSFANEGSSAQQVVTQIASEIFNQLPENGGTTTFVMTLNPESLGRVTVKLVEEAGKISVTVTAHSRHTAELLSGRFENLQASMKENGTQLEKYQVVYAPEEDERSGQQNYDGSSKNPYVRQDEEESGNDTDSEFAELLQQAV